MRLRPPARSSTGDKARTCHRRKALEAGCLLPHRRRVNFVHPPGTFVSAAAGPVHPCREGQRRPRRWHSATRHVRFGPTILPWSFLPSRFRATRLLSAGSVQTRSGEVPSHSGRRLAECTLQAATRAASDQAGFPERPWLAGPARSWHRNCAVGVLELRVVERVEELGANCSFSAR